MKKVLAVNSGSSSLKFQLFKMPEAEVLADGQIEKIGIEDSIFTIKYNNEKQKNIQNIDNHDIAVELLINSLLDLGIVENIEDIIGVGHRVVHGGELYSGAAIVDDEVKENIALLAPLAPLHNPVSLVGIEAFTSFLPHALQVVVFDTAFHQSMSESNFLYPLPYKYYEDYRIRRYGFHGTSHYYVSRRAAELMNEDITKLNMISVHLGNGASITAIKDGESINTSMGFTPLAGIMMGTRSGDVDPAIMPYLMEQEGMSASEVLDVFNNESGMLGVSGISSDARDIIAAYEAGDKRAITTLELYTNRIAEVIGSYFIQLERVDALVFTGGIGENGGMIRGMILDKIKVAMRLEYDSKLNQSIVGTESQIALENSESQIWVVPTDEELVIAQQTYELTQK